MKSARSRLDALVCIGAILVGLAVIVWMSQRSTLTSFAKVQYTADALAERGRLIARDLGYVGTAAGAEYNGGADLDYFNYLRRSIGSGSSWEQLRERPASLTFRYTESPTTTRLGTPEFGGFEPPRTAPGMIALTLDLAGRLTRLDAVPDMTSVQESSASQSNVPATPSSEAIARAWGALFTHAGLSLEQFTATPPTRFPPGYADTRAAWDGVFPDQRMTRVHIEAAAYAG